MRDLSLSWSLVLLVVIVLRVNTQAQTATTISLDLKDVTVEEVLAIISRNAGVTFSYNPKRIEASRKITYQARDKPLVAVLEDLSVLAGLDYEWVEGKVVLKPRQSAHAVSPHVTLSGFIKDEGNGEVLIGATVIIESLQVGVSSNAYGFYSLTVPKGNYTVTYSFVGFDRLVKVVDLNASVMETVSLRATTSWLEEIVVSAYTPSVVSTVQLGKSSIKPDQVTEKPALMGETDVVKALEAVPGVKFHSDGSTFYYVRGGNRDQNLILVDDAPIYNPSHLLGLFSTLIPEAINDMSLYKGSMPASLGGRLSSVMDVRTKVGNDRHFQASGDLGLLTSKLTLEGPIRKEKSSFMLSGRVSRVKWFFEQGNDDIDRFNFFDLTGKVNFNIDEKNKLFFSFYTGSDNYFTSNNGIEWSNLAGSIRWSHIFNRRLFLNTTLAGSVYDYFLHTDRATNTRWNSHISNLNLKSDFTYFLSPTQEITFGLSFAGYNFNPGNLTTGIPGFIAPVVSVRNSEEFVLYANHEIRLGKRLGLSYGLRLSTWANRGGAFEILYDGARNPTDTLFFEKSDRYIDFDNVEPRITWSYFINENTSLKANFSRQVQNIHLISNSISPFTSLEVWLPSSFNIQPQRANQVSVGAYRFMPDRGISVDAEIFYKKMFNQIDYEGHAETLLNPLIERELRFGQATAYGMELQARKETGRLRWWLGYSYSRAKRKFDGVNGGRQFNAFYDRPHQVNVALSYDFGPRWKASLNWNYYTGAPFSAPVSFFQVNGLEVPVFGSTNNDRLPDYHRMDISATRKLNRRPHQRFQHDLSFSIFNLYGRKNLLFINFNKTEEAGNFKIPANLLDAERVSSQLFLFGFIPSVTYNFKWR